MKKICKVYSVKDKNLIQEMLNKYNVYNISKSKGASLLSRDVNKIFWFVIFVKKNDYTFAKLIINKTSSSELERQMEVY